MSELYENFPFSLYYLIVAMVYTLVDDGCEDDAVGLIDEFQMEVEDLHYPAIFRNAYKEGYDTGYMLGQAEEVDTFGLD